MKLAAITDEISMDLDHALAVMQEYGCKGAELRSISDANIADLSDEQLDQARRVVEKRGIPVCGIASPLYKCDLPGWYSGVKGPTHQAADRTFADQMALLKRCHHLGKLFGTNMIRIFAFWSVGPELTPELADAIVDRLSEGVKYAEDNGLTLLMENEAACCLKTGADAAAVVGRIDSPALKVVWDPGNALLAGERPYPEGYSAVRNYVRHVHVKDAVILANGNYKFVVVGEGEVDYDGQFAALKDDGYTGYISLETHYRPFAGTAEQASRLCLQSLNRFLAGS
jgi:sugar phosphate isomerase/epimerase